MGALERQLIQWTGRLDLRELVRQLNERLRRVALEVTDSFRLPLAQLTFSANGNATYEFWIATESVAITAAWIEAASGAGTVDVQINGTSVNGSPFTFTTSAVEHEIASTNEAVAGDMISLVYSGTSARCVTTLKIRRLG